MIKNSKSRRLRKKLYLDEFSVLGFEISCQLNEVSNNELDSLLDCLIDELVARNLNIGGGGSHYSFGGFVTSSKRYASPSQKDADYIQQWLKSHSTIEKATVGELIDANYGDF